MGKFDIAPDHIKRSYEPEDRLCVALINQSTGQIKQEIRTAREIVDPKFQAHLRAANANGANVYLTVNTLHAEAQSRTKEDIDQIRHVYLDVDGGGKEAVDKILKSEGMPKPHAVMETSPGKHQILWQVEGIGKDEAEKLVRSMAEKHNADQAVWDSARVLRVPGFRNCKYEQPHYVSVADGGAERPYKLADFPRYERSPDAPQFGQRPQPAERSHGRGGSQSESDWAYALRALERGVAPEVITRKIADYRRGDKPQPERYAERTVSNARAHLVSAPPAPITMPRSSERSR